MTVVLFLNDKATNISELFLNENWNVAPLSKDINNIYSIIVNNKKINWIVKIYKKSIYAQIESKLLTRLEKVPNVPKLLASSFSNNLNFVIMSRVSGIDLFEYVNSYGQFKENELKPIVKKLLQILADIHACGVIHQDIKPENIVYDEASKDVNLIDFECKRTARYNSPEQRRKQKLTTYTDIYSLGITIYNLLTDKFPTKRNGRYHFPANWSKNLVNLLENFLDEEPIARYRAVEALNHEWFNSLLVKS